MREMTAFGASDEKEDPLFSELKKVASEEFYRNIYKECYPYVDCTDGSGGMMTTYVSCMTKLLKTGKYEEKDLQLLDFGSISLFTRYQQHFSSISEFISVYKSKGDVGIMAMVESSKDEEMISDFNDSIKEIMRKFNRDDRYKLIGHLKNYHCCAGNLTFLLEKPDFLPMAKTRFDAVSLALKTVLAERLSYDVIAGIGLMEKLGQLPKDKLWWILVSTEDDWFFVPVYEFVLNERLQSLVTFSFSDSINVFTKGEIIFLFIMSSGSKFPSVPNYVTKVFEDGLINSDEIWPIERFLERNGFSSVSDVYCKFWKLPIIVAEELSQ